MANIPHDCGIDFDDPQIEFICREIIPRFNIEGELTSVKRFGQGHINETFISSCVTDSGDMRYIHQRINGHVFASPHEVMDNITRVLTHLRENIQTRGLDPMKHILTIIPTRNQQSYFLDQNSEYWRTYYFIDDTITFDRISDSQQAYQAGKAFALFQSALSDLPDPPLHKTIPDFSNLAKRLADFELAFEGAVSDRASSVEAEIAFVIERRNLARFHLDSANNTLQPERIIHYDTKLHNLLFDQDSGLAICVIDLDTVMPGPAPYDFGDLVRNGASSVSEDEPDLSGADINLEIFNGFANGFLDIGRNYLTRDEIDLLPMAPLCVAFLMGVRFLTDYLAGDTYFKTTRADQNLDRCRTQFALVKAMEKKEKQMIDIIDHYC